MRNGILSISKFCLVVLIVIMHCFVPYKDSYFLEGAYIFVDFFFILQGFYLNPYIDKHADETLLGIKEYYVKIFHKYFPIALASAFLFCGYRICIALVHKMPIGLYIIEFFVQSTFTSVFLPYNMLSSIGCLWFLSAYTGGGYCAYGYIHW